MVVNAMVVAKKQQVKKQQVVCDMCTCDIEEEIWVLCNSTEQVHTFCVGCFMRMMEITVRWSGMVHNHVNCLLCNPISGFATECAVRIHDVPVVTIWTVKQIAFKWNTGSCRLTIKLLI